MDSPDQIATLAASCYRLDIIEEWGSETLKMADLASSSELSVPEIEDGGGAVTMRFRHGQFVPRLEDSEASPAQRWEEVLALLDSAEEGLTRGEVRPRLGVSERQARRALEELKAIGLVVSLVVNSRGVGGHCEGKDQTSGVMERLRGIIGASLGTIWGEIRSSHD